MAESLQLFHFTCDHGLAAIRRDGVIKPGADGVAWFSSSADAPRESLGLTSRILDCDRMAHRVVVERSALLHPWGRVRSKWPLSIVDGLELAPGAEPRLWWVAVRPVPVLALPVAVRRG